MTLENSTNNTHAAQPDRANALVTGGATGIGNAVAHKLASRGMNVLIADINVEGGQKVAEDLKRLYHVDAVFVRTDVSQENDVSNMVKTMVERWGSIDYACNNAGVGEPMETHEDNVTTEQFDRMYALNQRATWMCQKQICLQMRSQPVRKTVLSPSALVVEERGAVVNISSVNGLVGLGLPGYSAAKAGIQAITRNGAQFYGPHGIRVNAISPGSIRTETFERWVDSLPEEMGRYVEEGIVKATPLKRQGKPQELANVVSFLLSGESTFINGQNVTVDGAYTTVKY